MINPMVWKLRRVAAGFRQQDIAARAGMSTTRYSAIERGELEPNAEDVAHIERILPPLPASVVTICGVAGSEDLVALSCAPAKP